ncbi:MAG: DegT/DnrJ/EryC1/StrS family aminotransferase, partial [Candidatus Sericytochromatia bacterium]
IRVLSLHGMSKDAWKRYSNEGYKHYDVIYPGFKYNMTDIQSSLGLNQLKKISNFLEIRNKHWSLYNELLSEVEEIKVLHEEKDILHSRHLYIIKLDTSKLKVSRDEFMTMLIQENIGVSVHFKALHTHTYYKERFNLKDEDFPVATKLSDSVISLPFYPKLQEEDIRYVCDKIKELINKVLK